jgi:hypothetical protein
VLEQRDLSSRSRQDGRAGVSGRVVSTLASRAGVNAASPSVSYATIERAPDAFARRMGKPPRTTAKGGLAPPAENADTAASMHATTTARTKGKAPLHPSRPLAILPCVLVTPVLTTCSRMAGFRPLICALISRFLMSRDFAD